MVDRILEWFLRSGFRRPSIPWCFWFNVFKNGSCATECEIRGYWPKCVSGGMGLVGGVGVFYAGVEFVPADAGAVPVGDAVGFVCALWAVFPCFAVEFLDLLVTDGVGYEP